MAPGTYTAKCKAIAGTSSNCCASSTTKSYTVADIYPAFGFCQANRPCAAECGYLGGPTGIYTACSNVPITSGNICYFGTVDCCSCTEDPSCSLCDLGHGFCSFSGKDEYKETTCAPTRNCANKKLEVNTANENYCMDTGWQCKYTETAVQCCGDTDCTGYDPTTHTKLVCECPSGSPTCSITGTSYTCKPKPKCAANAGECASGYCCDADSGIGGSGDCWGPAAKPYTGNKWLCT
jgi:hypothetical protein